MESITLYCREGFSDKVYQASLQPQETGYQVHYAYGRRGSTLNTGFKTPCPVPYPQAKAIYDRLIREKTAKGYLPGLDAPVYQSPTSSKRPTGIQCQLLNPAPEDRLDGFIADREHWMQEKMDGKRLLLKKKGSLITGINRLGYEVAVPDSILQSVNHYRSDFILDGEAVGEDLHAFDVLSLYGEDIRPLRFANRCFRLRDFLSSFDHPHVHLVPTHCFPEKREWFNRLKHAGKEGVVFKQVDAPYTPGRPNHGGSQLKHKFYETVSCIVAKANDKRSVSLILFEGDKVRSAGNVTIPANHTIPKPGTVVECRYLYAFRESGSLYQPVFLGVREDIQHTECRTDQLKYKANPVTA